MANATENETTKQQIVDKLKGILEEDVFEDFIYLEEQKEMKEAKF